jgi:uncharacterized protein with HEPN domain
MHKLSLPTVHLNGTSGEELLAQVTTAAQAIRDALEALGKTAPHGRDYYIKSDAEYYTARNEFLGRVNHLEAVLNELEFIGENISDQISVQNRK